MSPSNLSSLMKAAEQAAKFADNIRGARIGAAALYRKSIFTGRNQRTSHPTQAYFAKNKHSIYLHAEVDALMASDWRAEALVIIRVKADSTWGLAKPCEGCQLALAGIDEVWYSTGIGFELERIELGIRGMHGYNQEVVRSRHCQLTRNLSLQASA